MCVVFKENIMKCFLVKKRMMNIETVFTRSKMVRGKYWQFLTKSYLIKIFKSRARNWYIMSQNEASLHNNVSFEPKNHFQRYSLFRI